MRKLVSLCFATLTVFSAAAWQDSLASIKLNRETFERIITGYINNSIPRGNSNPSAPSVGGAVTTAVKALSDSARASLVTELGLAAKAFVMSPAFATAYDSYIQNAYRAVNHGIQVENAGANLEKAMKAGNTDAMEDATNKLMRDSYRQGVVQRLPEVEKIDPNVFPYMVDSEMSMVDMSMPATAAEKANVAKAKVMFAEAKKVATSDIAKARSIYKSALMLVAGLKDEAAAASSAANREKQEQQENYNRAALHPNLKKQLNSFVALARTVDFKAPTTVKNGKTVFVNPAHERREELWKLLFRLGPGGTGAAINVAQGWLKEL